MTEAERQRDHQHQSQSRKSLSHRLTFNGQVTYGNMISWGFATLGAIVSAAIWLVSVRDTAIAAAAAAAAAAKQATSVAEQLAADSQKTSSTIQWMANQIFEIRTDVSVINVRVIGIEKVQDANTLNSQRLNQSFGVPVAKPPPRPPLPDGEP